MNSQELFESARPDVEPLSAAELETLFADVFDESGRPRRSVRPTLRTQ